MIKDNEPSVQVNGSGGVQLGHKTKHITVQTITIFLHKLYEVPDIDKIKHFTIQFFHTVPLGVYSPPGCFGDEVET